MPNRYVEFVKEYAIKNKLGWTCAVCEIKEKELYKHVKTLSVKAKEPEKIIIKRKKKRKKFKPKCYVNQRTRKNYN